MSSADLRNGLVALTAWRVGADKVSATQAIRRHSSLGLADANGCVDRVLEGTPVTIATAGPWAAARLADELRALGFEARAVEVPDARATVDEFWRLMASNDFVSVAQVLAADFVLEWPQTRERIRGAERFVRMNVEYPAHGPWSFTIHRVVAGDDEVATDVTVTDGVQVARAVSFFTVEAGLIRRVCEFWPEPYEPPAGRAHLVEPMARG